MGAIEKTALSENAVKGEVRDRQASTLIAYQEQSLHRLLDRFLQNLTAYQENRTKHASYPTGLELRVGEVLLRPLYIQLVRLVRRLCRKQRQPMPKALDVLDQNLQRFLIEQALLIEKVLLQASVLQWLQSIHGQAEKNHCSSFTYYINEKRSTITQGG